MVEHGDRSVAGLPLFEAANRLTSELADKNLLFTYYTNDRVMRDAATGRQRSLLRALRPSVGIDLRR